EVAVRAFLDERIPFTRIAELNERTMARHEVIAHPGLEDILEADRWARAASISDFGFRIEKS
ncbi:MAG: hypothetical protein KAJ81_07395, partial [Candidatus Latescibacteria bacterium]|nr:hypothetical protein [Candidatus Latescibacterota bacterium]